MSYCMGTGTLVFNKALPQKAYDALCALDDGVDWDKWTGAGENTAEISEDSMKWFDDDFPKLTEALKPFGIIITEGDIEYWGDYEGKYIIENNELTQINREDFGLYLSDDQRLIDELNRRGYDCIKREDRA